MESDCARQLELQIKENIAMASHKDLHQEMMISGNLQNSVQDVYNTFRKYTDYFQERMRTSEQRRIAQLLQALELSDKQTELLHEELQTMSSERCDEINDITAILHAQIEAHLGYFCNWEIRMNEFTANVDEKYESVVRQLNQSYAKNNKLLQELTANLTNLQSLIQKSVKEDEAFHKALQKLVNEHINRRRQIHFVQRQQILNLDQLKNDIHFGTE